MCKDVRNSYIVHKLAIQRVPYDIINYAVMRVFGIFLWGSPLKCHGDIMRVYDFKRLGTLHFFGVGAPMPIFKPYISSYDRIFDQNATKLPFLYPTKLF